MKRIDWIIGIVFLVVLLAIGLYYFLGYKKGKTIPELLGVDSTDTNNQNLNGSSNSGAQQSQALPPGSYPVLLGQKSELVVLIQKALNYLGADLIVDGVFGPATKSALQAETGAQSVTQEVAASLYVKVQNWANSKTPPDTTVLALLQKLVPY